MRNLLQLLVFLLPVIAFGQAADSTNIYLEHTQRNYTTKRTPAPIKIDGRLNDIGWNEAETASGFIALEPKPGVPADQPTFVKILYDDDAIYIGAFLKEVAKDSILRELTERDNIGNSDFFGIVFDPYQGNINGFEFIVTPAGTQFDAKLTTFGEDANWDAVWYSNTTISDTGWTVEMKIPYSAIRFPKKEIQHWNLNIIRNIRRLRQKVFWNELDPKIDGFLTQSGQLSGIENIKPPFRLQFFPYLAVSNQNSRLDGQSKNNITYSGGMDLRYGINDAFTLDMTLIPDFSAAQSDNTILNLSQFEVRYDEKRQFFTEGTELFDKADLIYWRRVGGVPLLYNNFYVGDTLPDGGVVISNPDSQQLINAFKISGRNVRGLGVGVFNGIAKATHAEIDMGDNRMRQELTDPLTNYNAIVIDQNLKNNSYISLINTNVSRSGKFYNANVLGTQFSFRDKSNTWGIEGSGSWNNKYGNSVIEIENNNGFTSDIAIGKVSGNLTFSLENEIVSDNYDRNDFGFLRFNNTVESNADISYNIYDPFGRFNKGGASFYINYLSLYNTGAFADFGFGMNGFLITKKFNAYGGGFGLEPIRNHNYFEIDIPGIYYLEPKNYRFNAWYSSDYSKVFAVDISVRYRFYSKSDQINYRIRFAPRVRVNNKLGFVLELFNSTTDNDVGLVDFVDNGDQLEPIMGMRDRKTFESIFNIKYTFTNVMGLNFRLRHYWAKVVYNQYYSLNDDGTLGFSDYNPLDDDGNDRNNINFNAFNIDMVYNWVFLPGSELSLIWKNIIQSNDFHTDDNYFENLSTVLAQDQINIVTLKVRYYLDFLVIQKMLRNKKTAKKGY